MTEKSKKEKIYAAVMELFKEGKNIKNIKVSDIADRAGIGKGSIYLHFASKDDVIVEAANYFFDTWMKYFEDFVVDESKDFKDVVKDFIDVHINLVNEYIKFFNPQDGADYINVFNSNTLPETIEIARNSRQRYINVLENVLQLGVTQNLISYVNRYSVNVVAESIMLMIKYINFRDIFKEDEEYTDQECMDLTYDMILRICK
ncbi:MAG: TetR/AcrR family transcriptional regulator [Eubacteriales bacterium]